MEPIVYSFRRWIPIAILPLVILAGPHTEPAIPELIPSRTLIPGGAQVTPDAGGPLEPEANTSDHFAGFFVKNTQSVQYTYPISCGVHGSATSCEPDVEQVTLQPNQQTDVGVTYSTGNPGSGSVVLRTIGDTGYYNLTVTGPGAPGVALRNQNDNNRDRSACLVAGAGEAAWQCGDLLVGHALPGFSTMGRERSLTLVYSSAQAVPQPAVAASVTNGDISLPQSVHAELRVTPAGGGTQVIKDSANYTAWNQDPNGRQIVLTYDASGDSTGAYPFTLEVMNRYPSVYSATRTGTLLIVNRGNSQLGAGWSLAGVEQLYFNQPVGTSNGDILWVGGDGSAKLYAKVNATTWVAPAGAYRDTLVYSSGTTEYTRTLRHGIQVIYNATGRQIRTLNRFEQPTYFYYNSSPVRLDSIKVPPAGQPNITYKVTYDGNGKLDKITDPVGRILDATVTSGKTLTLTDPDNVSTTFTYDALARMLTRTNRRNFRTRFEYANGLRVTKVFVPGGPTGSDTSVTEFKPWDEKGLPGQAAAADSGVYTTILGPRVNIPDDARFWVDKWGAPTKIVNASGATTLLTRSDASVPELVTRIDYPNGRIGLMTYNARGNLTETRDSTWHLASTVRDSTRFATYQYTSANAPDSPSRVGDSYNRYTYFYYNSTLGVTDSVLDLRGLVTVFYYQTSGTYQGLMDSVVDKNVTVWRESDSSTVTINLPTGFTYDAKGAMRTMMTPSGNVTTYVNDSIGRTAEVYDPLGARQRYAYDVLNRAVNSYQDTAKYTHPYGVTQHCNSSYLVCGDSTAAFKPALPAPLTSTYRLGPLTLDTVIDTRGVKRSFGYDAQGLQRIEQDEFGYQKLAFYDRGGLVDSLRTRDSSTVRFRYDTLGRRTFMGYPARATPFAGDTSSPVPGDSLVYTYDVMGNLLTARNRWNVNPITRTYYATGALKTQRTSYDSLYFEYDRNGNRRRMIMNSGKDTVDYSYGASGDLSTITARFDTMNANSHTMVFTFTWDKLGRRTSVTYPGNIVVTLSYDPNGALRQVKSVNPAQNVSVTDRLDFTWRNRQVDGAGRTLRQTAVCDQWNNGDAAEVPCPGAPMDTKNRYNRLGGLVYQQATGGQPADSMQYDGSGNMLFRYRGSDGSRTHFVMSTTSNRLAYDSTGSTHRRVIQGYNREGARISEAPADTTQSSTIFFKWYYYDGLGRLSGSRYATWTTHLDIHWNTDNCRYDADGQLVKACDNSSPLLYLDGPNAIGNTDAWWFVHGPGIDDPLVAVKRDAYGSFTRLLFIVTDGTGRRYAVGDKDGAIHEDDLNTNGGASWRYSGATSQANTFGAARMQNGTLPGVSYFRNRSYDARTGRWMQEDPLGLAGGVNLYQFNGNNPVMFTDPFGLSPEDCKKVKCPAPIVVILDKGVRAQAEEMYRATLKDGKERHATLFNGPGGTIKIGPTVVGTPYAAGPSTLPVNAIGDIHTHPYPGDSPLAPIGPSAGDSVHASGNNTMAVVRDKGALFILNTNGSAAYKLPLSDPQH